MIEAEVKELTYKLYKVMKEKGYPVKHLNGVKISRAKSFFGGCKFLQEYGYRKVTITITKLAIIGGYEEVKNTILHELCHACCDVGEGHNAKWKLYAKKISKEFNTNITTAGELNDKERKYIQDSARYKVMCDSCGHVYGYNNRTEFIRAVEKDNGIHYTCPCGGKHFHIE